MAALNFHRRQTRRWWYAGLTLVAAAAFLAFYVGGAAAGKSPPPSPAGPYAVPTGPIGVASGFADDQGSASGTFNSSDYNLSGVTTDPNAPATQPTFDWNSLAGGASNPSYTGTAPYQHAGNTSGAGGWNWVALTDAQALTSDTGFAGGTKEDKNCAAVIGTKAPNKDDMKRIYVAAQTINGHTYLNLAWVRIPQNTTSPSAHLAFEFNQGKTACVTGTSGGLVKRTAGDLLVLYDFTGGGVAPTITIARWITSGTCGVGSDSSTDSNGGCWGPGTTLDGSEAEANVDTGLNHICNTNLTPTGCGIGESDHNTGNTAGTQYVLPYKTTDHLAPADDTLGTSEFGEAGIDLTAAGVFGSGCTSFGQVDAISRTSGDSGTAAMEDLVGPGTFTLSNCTAGVSTQMQSSSDNGATVPFSNINNNAALSSGTYVRDKATVTVTGVNTWSGNVDFYLCKSTTATLTSCDPTASNATQIGGDVGVDNTTPGTSNIATSASTQITSAGSYCWAAVFTGTNPSDLPGASSTSGECFTATAPTSIATNPFFYPQDRVTISASSGGNLLGTVSWRLYDSSAHCSANVATVAGGLLYKEEPTSNNISGASPQSVSTNNTGFRVSATTPAMYWRVTYTSANGEQTNSSSVCVENIESTITADGTATFP